MSDIVIAVMGPTGSGKSTFIEVVTGIPGIVGHDLLSSTTKSFKTFLEGLDLCFVDTPGFDGIDKLDVEIFDMISDWINGTFNKRIRLAGLLYFHRISDDRMPGTPSKNLHLFEKLCGKDFHNIVLTTTMWDEVDEKVGSEREGELKGICWDSLIARGSSVKRFLGSRESALKILAPIFKEVHERMILKEPKDPGMVDKCSKTKNKSPKIVVVLGSTGSGKSNFIQCLVPEDLKRQVPVNDAMVSIHGVLSFEIQHRTDIVLVDVPGHDDSDKHILEQVDEWMKQNQPKNTKVTGILWLSQISANRSTSPIPKNLLKRFCGDNADAAKQIILVTTFWDRVSIERGERREEELRKSAWPLTMSAKMERFNNTTARAWEILDLLLEP